MLFRVLLGVGAGRRIDRELGAIYDRIIPDFVYGSRNVKPLQIHQPCKRKIVDDPALFRQIQFLQIDAAV